MELLFKWRETKARRIAGGFENKPEACVAIWPQSQRLPVSSGQVKGYLIKITLQSSPGLVWWLQRDILLIPRIYRESWRCFIIYIYDHSPLARYWAKQRAYHSWGQVLKFTVITISSTSDRCSWRLQDFPGMSEENIWGLIRTHCQSQDSSLEHLTVSLNKYCFFFFFLLWKPKKFLHNDWNWTFASHSRLSITYK